MSACKSHFCWEQHHWHLLLTPKSLINYIHPDPSSFDNALIFWTALLWCRCRKDFWTRVCLLAFLKIELLLLGGDLSQKNAKNAWIVHTWVLLVFLCTFQYLWYFQYFRYFWVLFVLLGARSTFEYFDYFCVLLSILVLLIMYFEMGSLEQRIWVVPSDEYQEELWILKRTPWFSRS